MIKTIYLPNEGMNLLLQENENLSKKLDQISQLYELNIKELKHQLELKNTQLSSIHDKDEQTIKQLLQKNQKLEQFNLKTN